MKKLIGLATLGAALVLSGCGESEIEKQAKEGTELSQQAAGTNRTVPRVVLTPDKPQKKDEGGK